METQTRLSRHNKFISAENIITILSVTAHFLVGREFDNILGDLGSIPCRVIPKTQKGYLMPPCSIVSVKRHLSR